MSYRESSDPEKRNNERVVEERERDDSDDFEGVSEIFKSRL